MGQPPIPIPEEFDQLDVADKRPHLSALRERMEESLDTDEATVEGAIFAEIGRRRAGTAAGTRRTLTRDRLVASLRAKYG